MARIAYFDCFSGISGDMAIAAFLDAGLSITKLSHELKKLPLSGYSIRKARTRRGAFVGTKFDVIVKKKTHSHHRSLGDIIKLIEKSSLNAAVKETAKRIFAEIGRAEAKVHGIAPKKEITLHELGDIDSIIDIVGVAIACDELGIDEVRSSPLEMGRTGAKTRHGAIPIPSPAAMELLKGAAVSISTVDAELVTPTGAGILKTLSKSFGAMPQMALTAVGYGAGSRNLTEMPNMLRVIIGERKESFMQDSVYVIETNIDDMNPQNFEYLYERLFKAGALDAFTTAVQMKKSRPGIKLTALADASKLEEVSSVIFRETTTIGLRYYEANRFKLERTTKNVRTRFGAVDVKISKGPDGIVTVSPEYEDCARLAREKRIPLRTVYEEAKSAVRV